MPYLRVKNEMPLIPGYSSGDMVNISDAFPGAPVNKLTANVSGSKCNVMRTGVNLFNGTYTEYSVLIEDGTVNSNPSHKTSTDYIYVKGVSSITLSGTNLNLRYSDVATGITRFAFYDVNKNFLSLVEQIGTSPRTTSVPSNAYYCLFQCGGKASDVQLEIGSTYTSYHAYTGTTYPINFPSSVADGSITIHSDGSVDLTSEGTTSRLTDTAQVTTTSGLNNIWVDTGDIENLVYIRR